MNPWIGNLIYLACTGLSIWIRIPHDKISQSTKVVESRRNIFENSLIVLVAVGMVLLPLLSFTPLLKFADRDQNITLVAIGSVLSITGLWLFYLSHRDLGKNWSASLELR